MHRHDHDAQAKESAQCSRRSERINNKLRCLGFVPVPEDLLWHADSSLGILYRLVLITILMFHSKS